MALRDGASAEGRLERLARDHALAVAVVASLALSLLPFGLWIDQLFLTFVHEAGHGLAAVATGGRFELLEVNADASGVARTRGGIRSIILIAGYAGACLWGGLLLIASRRRGLERAICLALAVFLAVLTLGWTRNLFGFVAGAGLASFFGWVAWRGTGWQLAWLLSFLAVRSLLNAFHDLWVLLSLSGSAVTTDAHLLSRELTFGLVPPIVFAGGIVACSVALLAGFARLAWPAREA